MKITGIIFCISNDYIKSFCQAKASYTIKSHDWDKSTTKWCHRYEWYHPLRATWYCTIQNYIKYQLNGKVPCQSYTQFISTFLLWQFSRTDKYFLIWTFQHSLSAWFSSRCLEKHSFFFPFNSHSKFGGKKCLTKYNQIIQQWTHLRSFLQISFGTPTDNLLYGIPGTGFGASFGMADFVTSCCFWWSRPEWPQNRRCCSRRGPRPMALPHPLEAIDSNLVAPSPPFATTKRSANSPRSMSHCNTSDTLLTYGGTSMKTWWLQNIFCDQAQKLSTLVLVLRTEVLQAPLQNAWKTPYWAKPYLKNSVIQGRMGLYKLTSSEILLVDTH